MSEQKKLKVNYKNRNYDMVVCVKDASLNQLKDNLFEGFNINRSEHNIKIYVNDSDPYELKENSMFQSLLKEEKEIEIILEVCSYDEFIRNVEMCESVRLNPSRRIADSGFSLAEITDSQIIKPAEDHKKDEEVEKVLNTSPSDIPKPNDYEIIFRTEVEEYLDQMRVKSEILGQKCGKCPFPPIGARYFCIFCEDMVLCSNCQSEHIHPLVKFNSSHVKTSDEMLKFFEKAKQAESKPTLKNNIQNSFIGQKFNQSILKRPTLLVEISFESNKILINPGNEVSTKIMLTNLSINSVLSKGLVIFPINNKDIKIESFTVVEDIPPKESTLIEIKIVAPSKLCEYSLKFGAYDKENEVNCICKGELKIQVGYDEGLTYEDFFCDYPDVLVLPLSQQKILYELIINEVTTLSIEEILPIMKKFKWQVEKALDSLTN